MPRQLKVVLIVEDEWVVRAVAAEALTDAGFSVIEAEDGDSALLALQHHAPAIDALFTDIRMPGKIDGLELARRARAIIPSIVVLIGSGNYAPNPADMPPGSRFLSKPYSLATIGPAVFALLDC